MAQYRLPALDHLRRRTISVCSSIFFWLGLVFGLIIAPALAYCGWLTPKRVLLWVVFAMLGHFAAAMCVTALTWRFQAALPITEESAVLIAAALAGTLAGGMLAGGNRLLVPAANWIAPTIVGGAHSAHWSCCTIWDHFSGDSLFM